MKFIVAGLGFGEQHLVWLSECPGVDIAGLHIRAPSEKADLTASKFGIGAVSKDLPSLIKEVSADAIVVATPPKSHASLIKMGMSAGLAVFSDKPLTSSLEDASQLINDSANSPGKAHVTFQWRHHAGIAYLRDKILTGAIGRLSHIEIAFHHDFLASQNTLWPWRHIRKEAGAGALGDQGVHLFDLVRFITRQEWSVTSATGHQMWQERLFNGERIKCETEDVASVALSASNQSSHAFVHVSRVATGMRSLVVRAFGTSGTIELSLAPDDGSGSLSHFDGATVLHAETYNQPSLNPYSAFLESQTDQTTWVGATFEDGYAAQKLLETAVSQIEQQRL